MNQINKVTLVKVLYSIYVSVYQPSNSILLLNIKNIDFGTTIAKIDG